MVEARAEHVGSLLRPAELLTARSEHAASRLGAAGLKAAEDAAVRAVVGLQEQAGCPVVTDGELRRESFQSELAAAVDGFEGIGIEAWLWGQWHSDELGDKTVERPPQAAVVRPLERRRALAAEEFTFLRAITSRLVKVTLPSPSLFASLWAPERSREAYTSFDDFMSDVVAVLQHEVRELARLGCSYVQIDAPHYPLLVDPEWRAFYEGRGWSARRWIGYGIELDNAVIDCAPELTFGFHLCRGNQDSRWLVAGGYDDIAAPIFGAVHADRLLLEYDDERSGGFEPLRFVPEDKLVVLGLITTKASRLEEAGELERGIRRAADLVGLDRLALGTQCGFSTSIVGNDLDLDAEWRKLELMVRTAEHVWG